MLKNTLKYSGTPLIRPPLIRHPRLSVTFLRYKNASAIYEVESIPLICHKTPLTEMCKGIGIGIAIPILLGIGIGIGIDFPKI